MDDPFDFIIIVKEDLENNDQALAAAKIQEYLERATNTPLNIGITGESGSGKSTFVNAFRGIDDEAEQAAPTGCVETTMEVKPYPHPNYPDVTLWDLPGIGTIKFPADEYLEHVGFEKFDFFIIISADRFRENDVKLAKEIQKMGKKFYFVRSKIDHSLSDEKRKKSFNEERTLKEIKENCIQGLQEAGVVSPKVFLVSSVELHLYDFNKAYETLNRELPEHKRDALLLAMPNISLEIINKKKEAFQNQIKWLATLSGVAGAVPIPGLSVGVDVGILVTAVKQYVAGFGLDSESLSRLATTTGVPVEDLKATIISPLAATKITSELIMKLLSQCATSAALMIAEEGSRFIPLLGIPLGMGLSFTTTYAALNYFLNMLAEDAQRVFTKALGLDTNV